MSDRWDETWHRLLAWTNEQAPSERLAAIVLADQGYSGIDPSHPLGGQDGQKDALCEKDGQPYVMAVYFPRGQQSFNDIRKKFKNDLAGVAANSAVGIAFVTNQELRLAERQTLKEDAEPHRLDLFHVERLTVVLDSPHMAAVRKQFLGIGADPEPTIQVGGQGGAAPGAGGGGGGVIGSGRGGDGGAGGKVVLDGQAAQAPGAGGGGAGAEGPFSWPGSGGEGGELVAKWLKVEPGKTYEVKIGRGGAEGEDGGDTSFGDVLIARGGKAGKPGKPPLLTRADVESGCSFSMLLTSAAEIRAGLLGLLGGGWESFEVYAVPYDACWPAVLFADLSVLPYGDGRRVEVDVRDPEDSVVAAQEVTFLRAGRGAVARPFTVFPFQFRITSAGTWKLVARGCDMELLRLPIDVRVIGR